MKNKLVLGTAQFSKKYGVTNKKGVTSKSEITKILYYLKKKYIYDLDTSIEYNLVDEKIKLSKYSYWKIITKVDPDRFKNYKNKNEIKNNLIKLINKSAKNIGVKKIETLLLHNVSSLFRKNGNQIYIALKELRESGYIKNFGYSIYNFEKLHELIKKFKPDVLQCPFNVIDRRLNNKNIINLLKKNEIKIHARSIFLQGLLLIKLDDLPKKFFKWKKIFQKWDNWITKYNYSRLEACLNFSFFNSSIDKIIFGIDDLNQLKEILDVKLNKKIIVPSYLASNDKNLIDPLNWR